MASMQTFIESKNHAPEHLGRVLVLGLGKSGCAAVRYTRQLLGSRVESVFVAAGKHSVSSDAFAQEMACEGVEFAFDCESFSEHYDICIASPGISQVSDFYQNAAAAITEIMSEVEFAWRESNANSTWVCITGTNGKTTTTSLVAHILQGAGKAAAAVGNIGDVCLDAVALGKTDVYVAELSSYQLASTKLFAPQVSVLLNITPDHLSWHKGFDNYTAAKFKALENLHKHENAVAILDATDEVLRKKIKELKALPREARGFDYIPIGTASGLHESMIERCGAEAAAYCNALGALSVEYQQCKHTLCQAADLNIKGTHNLANALAAAAACVALGVDDTALIEGLTTFEPLEHRIEPCGVVNDVAFYNDSKGTNVDATLKAYTAFTPGNLIVLLGGRDKGTDLTELVRASCECARAVVLYGEARERFAAAFAAADDTLQVFEASGMKQAFQVACEFAHAGDVVLLSPACASFDEFSCFEERGDTFKAYVAAYASGNNN